LTRNHGLIHGHGIEIKERPYVTFPNKMRVLCVRYRKKNNARTVRLRSQLDKDDTLGYLTVISNFLVVSFPLCTTVWLPCRTAGRHERTERHAVHNFKQFSSLSGLFCFAFVTDYEVFIGDIN